jgi:aminoglycoside phosphotransferase (APT) family kinase protein
MAGMNPKVSATALLDYYRGAHPNWEGVSVTDLADMTSGWETELYGFTLEYVESGVRRRKRLVVRLPSGRFGEGKAEREYAVMGGLRTVGYPVPEVYDLELTGGFVGKPFLILDRVPGRSMLNDFLEIPRESLGPHIATISRLFTDLHRVDSEKIFPDAPYGDTHEYLEMRIHDTREEVEDRSLGWFTPVLDWLYERRRGVSDERVSVLHRDFHPGNIMVRPDGSHAVIDWGASRPGDYREDLLWTVLLASAFWNRSFGEAFLQGYEAASGREVRDVGYWEVTGILRRMMDVTVSLTAGAEEMGMRAGAVERMKESLDHLHNVHSFLMERTGIRLPEFDELLKGFEG